MQKSTLKKAMDALFQDFDEAAMRQLYREDYIQHNPAVPTGLDAVIGLLPLLKQANFGYTTHRMLEDGDLIATHTTYHNADVFGANKVVAFDLWRMEDGKVAEHWDCIVPLQDPAAGSHGQTDGAVDITDLSITEKNKELVKSFFTDVFIAGDFARAANYTNGHYAQHGTGAPDGIGAIKEYIAAIKFHQIHRVIGEGNFVLTQSEGTRSSNGKACAAYDLFRVEDGKIVEHWNVVQDIPESLAHGNGMF